MAAIATGGPPGDRAQRPRPAAGKLPS